MGEVKPCICLIGLRELAMESAYGGPVKRLYVEVMEAFRQNAVTMDIIFDVCTLILFSINNRQ